MKQGRMGFTLVEVLLVAAMLGILAEIAVPHLTDAIDNAAAAAIVVDARTVNVATQSFLYTGGTLPETAPWGQAPPELNQHLEETMTFSRRDAVYRFVTQPLSGTTQLLVEYPEGSPVGQALQAFRRTGEVTWTPTQTTFFLVQ